MDKWYKKYNSLLKFVESTGEFPKWKNDSATTIWINRQKLFYKQGTLGEEKTYLLESIKGWSWRKRFDTWEYNYNALCDYVLHNDKLPTLRGTKISYWINRQREIYKKGRLEKDRIDRLEKIKHWKWSIEKDWNTSFNKFHTYVKTNKRMPGIREARLSSWVRQQRIKYERNKLEFYQIKLLESVSFWTWKYHKKRKASAEIDYDIPKKKLKINDFSDRKIEENKKINDESSHEIKFEKISDEEIADIFSTNY